MRAYLIYTLLFAVCSAGVFFAFWIGNYSMIIKPDGYLQHYTALVKLRHNGKLFSGSGISTDIIGSSISAYINAVNKIVYEEV